MCVCVWGGGGGGLTHKLPYTGRKAGFPDVKSRYSRANYPVLFPAPVLQNFMTGA